MIICGDFNLPQISWIPNTAQYQTSGTVDHRVLERTNVLQNTAELLDLKQCYPPHKFKGYTLDLLISSTELC